MNTLRRCWLWFRYNAREDWLVLLLGVLVGVFATLWATGCHAHGRCTARWPAWFVGSTSMTVEELERRKAEAYPPDLEVWEAE